MGDHSHHGEQVEFDGLGPSPATLWNKESAKRALDELFTEVESYRSSERFLELLEFTKRFRQYAPFNAMLVHIQKPGSTFVAPASRWWNDRQRRVRAGAHPLVILRPRGPVMFVFDVSDTEGPPLPAGVEQPFEPTRGEAGDRLARTIENAKRDGIRVERVRHGSQSAGSIRSSRRTTSAKPLLFRRELIPLRFELLLNESMSREARYATLVHELAHLYCGHIGTPDPRWWPDRRGLPHTAAEFEAESVTYLVCGRAGIENPSAEYLHRVLADEAEVPAISLDRVMAAAGLVEQMGASILPTRRTRPRGP
jgi:hypothetical protein